MKNILPMSPAYKIPRDGIYLSNSYTYGLCGEKVRFDYHCYNHYPCNPNNRQTTEELLVLAVITEDKPKTIKKKEIEFLVKRLSGSDLIRISCAKKNKKALLLKLFDRYSNIEKIE